MQIKTQKNKYGLIRKANHWIVALMFMTLLTVGTYMHGLPDSNPEKWELYSMHKSFGIITMLFIIARIAWLKFDNKIDNSALTKAERIGSASLHGMLYLIMLVMPISGMLMSMYFGYDVNVLNLVTLPMLVEQNAEMGNLMANIHALAGKLAIVLLVGHVGASLFHHFVKKDNILRRMI